MTHAGEEVKVRFVNFNSHAHVERDRGFKHRQNTANISTHTLTWSVTFLRYSKWLKTWISTHTLTWSVTTVALQLVQIIKISTHTLTWSVT